MLLLDYVLHNVLTLIFQMLLTIWVEVLGTLLMVSCVNQARFAKVDRLLRRWKHC